MTNYKQDGKRGFNQKDGRQQISPTKAHRDALGNEFEDFGFTQIDWNKWQYTWEGNFPVFRLVTGSVAFQPGWIAICDNPEIQIPIGQASPAEIKVRLDDEILDIMRHAAEIIDGQMIGPEIRF